uniref:Knl1 C-terminal RWD domain-containing protein n=1 Tax=Naja naja TaxID=35670 RepID=A0A8C6X1K2_NAJNA
STLIFNSIFFTLYSWHTSPQNFLITLLSCNVFKHLSAKLNIVDRTLIFSEQNEMDMTSGHTILITHDTKVCQETDKPKKINFESFLSEIKSEKKSNLSQQKTNTEKTHKIHLGDFLESLRSTKSFSGSSDQIIPSGGAASERSTYSSKQNACSHLQTENCNMPTVFGELDNRQHGETSALSFEKAILSASKQLGCAESMDVINANTERLLPSGTSTSSMINQQQDLGKDKSVAHSTVSYTLRTSNYQPGIQQNTNMSPSKINVNNKEANINHNSAVKITNKDILPSQTSFGTITALSVTSVPILHGDKTNFSEDMELTKNCTGLIWEVHSKGTDSPVHGLVQKQRNDVFELMDRTNFREIEMDITKNHASMNSYLSSMHHSNLVSKMTTADQQNDHGNMDLNQRVNLSTARNINLNTSQVPKNFKEQVETPLVPYTTSGITKWTNSAIEDSTINRTSGLSNNAVSLIPEHENVFAPSENMEISKAVGSLRHNSLKPVAFRDIAQQLTSASRKSITDSDSGNVMALPLSEDNEMEITKSCTVPVNYNMLRHERTTEVFPLEPVDKTTNIYNDMDETKPITCIISQHVENSGSQIMQQQKRSGTTNPTKDRTVVFSLNDGNEMDITRSYTVALNHDAVTFAEDRPVLSTQNAGTGRKTIESDSDTSVAFPLSANNKLEFRKNLTEAVEKATQEQTSSSEENININISNHMPVNKSMSFAPADKTVMFVHNNDMEITKPISMTSIKNTGFETLQLKNKENGKAILIKSAKEGTDLCLLDENEMEMTRSHTVAVNYELQHAKAAPQKLFLDPANETSLSAHNNYETISKSSSLVPAENTTIMRNHDMEMTKSLSADIFKNSLKCLAQKRNLNCESSLADVNTEWEFSSNQTANEPVNTNMHAVLFDNKTIEYCQVASQAKHLFPFNEISAFTSYQNGTETTSLHSGALSCGNLQEFKKEMLGKNMEQNHEEKTNYLEFIKKNTVTNKEHNCYLLPAEKQIPSTSRMSKEKTVAFSDDGNMEVTGNYTTGIERIFMSDRNECELHSLGISNVEFSASIVDCEKKLNIDKTTSEKSIVQMQQSILHTKERQLEPCTAKINNHMKETTNLSEELPKLIMKPDCSLKLKEDRTESNAMASKAGINTSSTEGIPLSVSLNTDNSKIRIMPLAIFPPKLPNKRKSALSNIEAPAAKLDKNSEIQDSKVSLPTKSSLDKITQKSGSFYIDEELLPSYAAEMDSNESLCDEVPGKCSDEIHEKMIVNNEMFETNQNLKRPINQENEDIQGEKKFKKDMDWNDITEQRQVKNSKLETQLLMDSICEQNLQEKLLEGTITVREFFILLQVHVLIQIPRQSHLPVKHTVNTSSIPEDEILSHCIYHPKLQVYKEDCQTLHMTIEELKIHAADQDKLLVNINKSFWEVMKTCSGEELRGFGAELNKMKSCFTKKSKILAHKGKAKLYVKLVHHTKLQFEKLQSRLAKMDELLKEMDSCLFALEKGTTFKIFSQFSLLNFSEWVIKEWNDHQAVFTFLYDSIELTVGFKYPLDDATFGNKLYWEIVSLNFETLLDETKAAPTAKLVHKLIFQFIDSQNSWQKKCSTVHQLSQMLHDLSLVVNRCQLLGEEIEFLNKWGGKFYLLKTEVNNTNVSLLFSSSTPFAKFEVEVSLSANYPTSPIVFTIQKCTGNLCHDEISVVLSSVPVGTNYLKRMVNQISCYLLQYPSAIPKNKRATVQ